MSHEFRTPLNVVIGYADILAEEVEAPEVIDCVKRIHTAGRELLEMIEATLDLGRIESGNAPPRIETFDTIELFDELEAEFAAVRRPESPRLVWETKEHLAARSDRRKFKIVLKNLVSNALKFTPQGTVVVSTRVERGRLGVSVRDTGIGIPADALPTIFDMFRQVDSSDTRSYGGVGLGLYIVRRLVDQLGAEIQVESAVGRGTTFDVLLPVEPPAGDERRGRLDLPRREAAR
jgi:signal transduction histidine kinase